MSASTSMVGMPSTRRMSTRVLGKGPRSHHLSEAQIDRVRQIFEAFDEDGSGTINKKEMQFATRELGLKLSKDDFDEMFDLADSNGDGEVDFEEYCRFMKGSLGEKNEKEEIEALFNLFVDKRVGTISMGSLSRGAKELGLEFSSDEIFDMLDEADKGHDGVIDLREFMLVAKKTGLF